MNKTYKDMWKDLEFIVHSEIDKFKCGKDTNWFWLSIRNEMDNIELKAKKDK